MLPIRDKVSDSLFSLNPNFRTRLDMVIIIVTIVIVFISQGSPSPESGLPGLSALYNHGT